MKTKIYLLLLFLMTINGFAQETKMSIKDYVNFSDLPSKTSNMPSWANQFYSNPDQININNLKKELNDWLIEEKEERKENISKKNDNESKNEFKESISENPIVRFAIDFVIKIPNEWINEKGFLNLPTKQDFINKAENYEKNRNTTNKKNEGKNALVNNWEQIGTLEVVKNDKQVQAITNILFLNIAPSSTNVRLASTETGSLFKTMDGGENWAFLSDYGGSSAFHPTDSNKIILGSNPFRYSSNGGSSWSILPVVATCNEILWSNNGTTIIAATEQGVYVSSDAGATFSLKQSGSFMDVEFKPGSSSIVYAINNQGVFYKSNDAGLTWVIKPTNYTLNTVKRAFLLAVSDANPELISIAFLTESAPNEGVVELIKSTNGGENFSPLSVSNIGFSQGSYSFVFGISPTDLNIYYIGVADFLKSTNGGLNFNVLGGYGGPLGISLHPDIQDMVILGNKVVLSTDGGVGESPDNFTDLSLWKSTSKGLFSLNYFGFDIGFNTDQMGGGKVHNGNDIFNPNWNNRKSLLVEIREAPVGKAIFSRPNSLFYADMNPKQFKQIDVDYNPIFTNSFPFTLENNSHVNGLRNSDTTSNTVDSNIIYAGFENNVLISYDNGATSQILKSFSSLVWDVKTTRKDAKVIYVMTQTDGLWKTSDGGANWISCNMILNNVDLKSNGVDCYIDVSQTNANEIWLTRKGGSNITRIFKSTDGGQVWTDLNTPTLNQFNVRQIQNQYGSNGGVYLMGDINSISKCFYRNNTMSDWVDYSSNLMLGTALERVFLKASYYKERLIVASAKGGVQTIPFYEKSNPVAQPTTNVKDICVNQEIKFSDYSILDYTAATWEWSFSKTPVYLNGTSAGSRDPIVKFLSPGVVNATLKVTNSSGISDTKTITNFVNVNYNSASCSLLDSDYDIDLGCVSNIASSINIGVGGQVLITNFNNATTGKFLVNLNFFNNCTGANGSLIASVNLDTNQINVIRYNHFGGSPIDMLGNNTSNVTSNSNYLGKVSFSLANNSLYLNHISNACSSGGYIRLTNSCWKPYIVNIMDNGDYVELQKCDKQIPQSASITGSTDILVTDFANATSGLFYVNLNTFTSCNNATNNLKAIVNLDSDIIHVLGYQHFASTNSDITGNETSSVTSTLTTNAQVNYFISNNKLYVKRIYNPCGNGNFRLNPSCWSAMDDDQNGIDNTLQPSNCNNTISGNVITDSNANLIKDFSSFAATQKGVFVTLNISTSCNNTTATAYLNIDLDNNIIHVINYKHFGSTIFSTVLNNDSPNVYSESAANGKLKFSLVTDKLYIQRVSTPCAGSSYQVTNSCYSLAADQVLAIENFISHSVATIVAFPNPTTNSFTIDTKSNGSEYSLSIYNIDGKFITSKFEKTTDNLLQVNMEQYAEGLYFVIVYNKTDDKYNYLKIIKK
ncbi:T9SS type A sorting domain-containing protein [Flavobacterium sp.]|uniref:T9SS type A sorting domain-containing protein n=1 Tax=Flavobacterium sp. TaxID=239 RepID=UPI00286BD831|nr:T9SS type A sorting domain-containing protein [Flavobacterium sp.]